MVGAVIVRNHKIIGEGWHRKFGGPHAEVDALRRVKESVRGATMYVTLEPCSHTGKTPPCADALIEAGLKRVVVAMRDPFEEVAGRGIARLRKTGIQVDVGICSNEAKELNRPYLKRVQTGLPWVIAKWAQTLDGRIATRTGDSKWISNPESRRLVHQLRARVDAIMVGITTALSDDPQLTARDVPVRRIARRVVIDPKLKLPADCRLIKTLDTVPLTVATSKSVSSKKRQQFTDRGVEVLPLASGKDGKLRLRPLLKHLCKTHQATNVMLEGGAGLIGAMLKQKLIDQAYAFVCPKLLGDDKATSAASGMSVQQMNSATALSLQHIKRIGDDVLLDYLV